MRAPETLKYGAAKSPGLGLLPSSKFFRQTRICMSAVVASQYRATIVAAEILDSTHRVSSLRRDAKIEKFGRKTKFLKQTNTLSMCRNFRSID
jgi:hypothetical protein